MESIIRQLPPPFSLDGVFSKICVHLKIYRRIKTRIGKEHLSLDIDIYFWPKEVDVWFPRRRKIHKLKFIYADPKAAFNKFFLEAVSDYVYKRRRVMAFPASSEQALVEQAPVEHEHLLEGRNTPDIGLGQTDAQIDDLIAPDGAKLCLLVPLATIVLS